MSKEQPPVLGIRYKWVASVVLMFGIFMTLLDTTIVDITLPKMLASLNTDTYGVQWVVIAYMIGSAVAMTLVGWMGAATSYRFVYIFGLLIFVVFSAICGQANSLGMMITGRLIQGIGEGLVVPISMTYLFLVFPRHEAGLAMGIYGLGASFAPALGPTIGGFLTEHLNWRWIFYVNLPIGGFGLILAAFLLRRIKPEDEIKWPFDWIGFILLATSLGSLITFLSKGQEKGWFQSDMIVILIASWILSSIGFLIWESCRKNPVVDLRLFNNRLFSISIISLACFSLTLYAVYFLLPLYMERLREYPTLLSGLILFPGSIAMGIALIIGGILSDRMSVRTIAIVCIIAFSISCYAFGSLDLTTPKEKIIVLFVIWGIAAGPLFPALTTGGLSKLQISQVSMGSAIQNVTRLVAGSIGTSLAVTLLERRADYFYVLFSRHTEPGNMPFSVAWKKAVDWFISKGSSVAEANIQAKTLINLYITAKSYFTAYQSAFKILALFALMAIPFLLFFRASKIEKKPAVH